MHLPVSGQVTLIPYGSEMGFP